MIPLLLLAAQAATLPRSDAPPPPGTEEAAVLAPVEALLAAIAGTPRFRGLRM